MQEDYGVVLMERIRVYEAIYGMDTPTFIEKYEARSFGSVEPEHHDWWHTAQHLKFLREVGKTKV